MKAPVDTGVTDIGNGSARVLGGARILVKRIDVNDPDQVFDLAAAIAHASDRRVMQMTIAETRAMAIFAVETGFVASRAAVLADAARDMAAGKRSSLEPELTTLREAVRLIAGEPDAG